MDKKLIDRYALRYNLTPEEIELYIPISNKYNIHLYEVKRLFDIYGKEKYVIDNIQEGYFINKVEKWLSGDYKIYDTNKFKQSALTHIEKEYYTDAPSNQHPQSSYMKFWTEEMRRSLYGYYVDKEWISGYNYFYLNYTPIELVESLQDGDLQGDRVVNFPYFWDGDFFYFHYLEEAERNGLSAVTLKTRGRGMSWKAASMPNRNFYLIPRSRSILYASSSEFLSGGDGVLTKCWSQMGFLDKHTAWAKRRQKKNTDNHRRASIVKYVNGVEIEDGFLSEIMGVSLKDDADKARGRRAKLIIYEEAGTFKNIIQSWIVAEPSIKQGRRTFGLRCGFGTGGTMGEGFEGLRKFFYTPGSYKIYSLPNMWVPNSTNNETAWFSPEYVNREGFYDKDGNSDMSAAKEDVLKEREIQINAGADGETILRTKAEYPLIPDDAILKTSASPFPRTMIKEQLIRLEEIKLGSSRGRLIISGDSSIKWMEDLDTLIIENNHPTKFNRKGGIEIFEHPIQAVKESPYGYIIGVDPVDYDYSEVGEKYSLGSCFVMNTFTNKLVAEYTGRPDLANEFYETVKRLAIYYGGTIMYENNIKGLHTYFINQMYEHLLAKRPKILDESDMLITSGGRKKYGVMMDERTKKLGIQLLKNYLTEPIPDTDGLTRIHSIQSRGLLNELMDWHHNGNFDRVMAMLVLMLFYQDIERLLESELNDTNKTDMNKFWTKPFVNK